MSPRTLGEHRLPGEWDDSHCQSKGNPSKAVLSVVATVCSLFSWKICRRQLYYRSEWTHLRPVPLHGLGQCPPQACNTEEDVDTCTYMCALALPGSWKTGWRRDKARLLRLLMIWWATAIVTVGKKVVSREALYCKSHKSLSPSKDSWEGFLEEVGQAEVVVAMSGKVSHFNGLFTCYTIWVSS